MNSNYARVKESGDGGVSGARLMMETVKTEKKARLRSVKSREAIGLALEGNWEQAVEVNREVLRLFPDDVEALNRLGKAFMELGRYSGARSAFESAARISPYNSIARKNLERLPHLEETARPPKQSKGVSPYLFIEERGKSCMTALERPAAPDVLGRMATGDPVELRANGHALLVENQQGDCVGRVESKLGMRLMRLMKAGNRYEAVVVSVSPQDVSVIILETYRHRDTKGICSFPTNSKDEHRKPYWTDALLRYDVDTDLEDEEAQAADWRESYRDSVGFFRRPGACRVPVRLQRRRAQRRRGRGVAYVADWVASLALAKASWNISYLWAPVKSWFPTRNAGMAFTPRLRACWCWASISPR